MEQIYAGSMRRACIDLCWLYEAGVHTGFYDLKDDRETTIEEILQKQI